MKCSACGSEMKFVGSLASGHLECPSCTAKPVDPVQAAPASEPYSVTCAKARLTAYEDYQYAGKATCPYCNRLSGHLDPKDCASKYSADEKTVTYYVANGHVQPVPVARFNQYIIGDIIDITGLHIKYTVRLAHLRKILYTIVINGREFLVDCPETTPKKGKVIGILDSGKWRS